jgi:hypothetical protein
MQLDTEELLTDPKLVTALETDITTNLNESPVRRAQVRQKKAPVIAIELDEGVTPRQERVIGENNVARLATQDRLHLADMEKIARDPLDGTLSERRKAGPLRRSEEQSAVLAGGPKPIFPVFHNLKL